MPAGSGAGREEGAGAHQPSDFPGGGWDPGREPGEGAEGDHLRAGGPGGAAEGRQLPHKPSSPGHGEYVLFTGCSFLRGSVEALTCSLVTWSRFMNKSVFLLILIYPHLDKMILKFKLYILFGGILCILLNLFPSAIMPIVVALPLHFRLHCRLPRQCHSRYGPCQESAVYRDGKPV